MKRVVSWLVFALLNGLIYRLGALVISLLFLFIDWLGDRSFGVLLFFISVAGGACFFILLLPYTFGIGAVITTSETICPSRNGARYKVWAIIEIVCCAVSILVVLFGFEFRPDSIYGLIYGIVMICSYKSYLGETWR